MGIQSEFLLFLCSIVVIHCEQNLLSPLSSDKLNPNRCNEVMNDFSEAQIILFFAPAERNQIEEQLVVYYKNPKLIKNLDIIAIYENEHATAFPNIIYSFSPSRRTGFKYTQISPTNRIYSANSTFHKQCLGKKI